MLFRGWGMQNRHTLRIGHKLLIWRELSVKIHAGRKCLLFSGMPGKLCCGTDGGEMSDGPCACAQMSVPFCPACSSGHRESQRSAPCGTRRSASFAAANALRVWVSKQKSPCGCGPGGRDFSSGPPQKARPRPREQTTLAPSGGVLQQITPGAQRRSKP